MKTKFAGFLVASLASVAMFGCSVSSNPDAYFTIDIYTDYEGIEADIENHSLDTSKAEKVGYCYAMKGQKALTAGIKNLENAPDYRKSKRDPGYGYHYSFDGFVGFYDDGKPIDLMEINANCSLFASFEKENNDYVVTVKRTFDTAYSERLPYLTKVGDVPELLAALSEEPEYDPHGEGRDPYYQTHHFSHWNVFEYDDSGELIHSGMDHTSELSIAEAKDYVINRKVTFSPAFLDEDITYNYPDDQAGYTVTYKRNRRTLTGYDVNSQPVYAYEPISDEVGQAIVAYNQALPIPEVAGYKCVGTLDSRYPENAPEDLLEPYFDEANGKMSTRYRLVDLEHIVYSCHVELVYEAVPETYTVKFLGEDDSVLQTGEVKDGGSVKAPSYTPAAGKVFFKQWTATKGGFVPVDLNEIHGNLTLYPIVADEEISYHATNYTLSYVFDQDLLGYALSGFELDAGHENDVIALEDLAYHGASLSGLHYDLVRLKGFPGGTDDLHQRQITSLKIPGTVKQIDRGCITPLRNLTGCVIASGIETLSSGLFANLLDLTTVSLPSSLQKVGAKIFRGCTSITSIQIDLTEAEVAAREFAEDWYQDAPAIAVSYKI